MEQLQQKLENRIKTLEETRLVQRSLNARRRPEKKSFWDRLKGNYPNSPTLESSNKK